MIADTERSLTMYIENTIHENATLTEVIIDQTNRALWEVKNVIACVPENLWNRDYCEMPLYKHIYHMLHSLDRWYINPNDPDYNEPKIHIPDLNNLDAVTDKKISFDEINDYYLSIEKKIKDYLLNLSDKDLYEIPLGCKHNKFKLILGQFRHLHTHMGMIMGWIIESTRKWPTILGLERPIPVDGNYNKFC